MSTLLGTVVPVFGIMLVGYLAARTRLVAQGGVKGLVHFVFNLAIPVLLFRSLAHTRLPDHVPWGFVLSFYGGAFACFALGMVLGRTVYRRKLDEQVIFGMSAGYTNLVLLGIPILLAAYGPEASLPIFLLIALHSPTLMPLSTGLIEWGRGGEVSAGGQLRAALRAWVGNPIIVGLLLGLAVNLTGLTLPESLDRMTELLGAAAIPCALFATGGSLAAYPLKGDLEPALVLGSIKVVLHPLLVWILAVPVLGLGGLWVKVAVGMAAMPTGVNTYIVAARYEAAPGLAARTVLVSTLMSVGTLSAVLVLV